MQKEMEAKSNKALKLGSRGGTERRSNVVATCRVGATRMDAFR
jgi:hypothetical protein